jgi:uncharacterized protein DUF4112
MAIVVEKNHTRSDSQFLEVEILPPPGREAKTAEVDSLIGFVSRLLDTVFAVPGTRIRFGLEPIIGLVPVLGDQVTSLMSAALLCRSVQHRLPKIALVRMALNILINGVIGMVPLIGNLFVLWYKPNIRNYRILQRYAGQAKPVTENDWRFVVTIVGATFFLIVTLSLVFVYAFLSQFRWW